MRHLILSSALIAAPLLAAPPDGAPARLKQDLTTLAGPEMKGRGNGHEGLEKAAAYLVEAYRKLGLRAEIQRVPFSPSPVRIKGEARLLGPAGAQPLAFDREIVFLHACQDGTLAGAPMVFAGYGVQTEGYNDLAGLDLKGKVVVIGMHPPARVPTHPPSGSRDEDLGRRVTALARTGAAAVLVAVPGDALPANLAEFPLPMPIPAGALAMGALKGLEAELKSAFHSIEETGRPASRMLGAALDLELARTRLSSPLPNVVATLPGRDPKLKDETIVIGAHLDHLAPSRGPDGQETVFPGANDNGSGTVALLEIARRLKEAQPRRAVTFIHFGGEEAGLLGSRHWAKQAEKVRFMANLDMVGRLDPARRALVFTGMGLDRVVQNRLLALAPRDLRIRDDRGSSPFAERSDHFPFFQAGVPSVTLSTGEYGDYHQPTDTVDKINFEGLAEIADYTGRMALSVANADETPAFAPRPRLGIAHEALVGLRLSYVAKDSPAGNLGLQKDDLLTRVGDFEIKNGTDLTRALEEYQAGDTVEVRWIRGQKPLRATAVLK